jgi:signal transduction histidine kinase
MLLDYDKRISDDDRLSHLRSIAGAADRLESIVADLLLLSNAEAGRLPLNLTWTDLLSLVEETVRSHERTSPDRRFKVQVSPLQLAVDAIRMRQVLDNLIGNAIKYSQPESEIEINSSLGDKEVTLSVRDRGPGVPPEALESIFEPFTRAVNTGQKFIPGSGLGLAICRSIAQAHGGRVWASLPQGGGLSITVALPIQRGGEASFEVDPSEGASAA